MKRDDGTSGNNETAGKKSESLIAVFVCLVISAGSIISLSEKSS
jgi:hypothetical protein